MTEVRVRSGELTRLVIARATLCYRKMDFTVPGIPHELHFACVQRMQRIPQVIHCQ